VHVPMSFELSREGVHNCLLCCIASRQSNTPSGLAGTSEYAEGVSNLDRLAELLLEPLSHTVALLRPIARGLH
jgi:hypothetical protein